MTSPYISLSPAEIRRLAGGSRASDSALAAATELLLSGDEVWTVVTEWARQVVQLAESDETLRTSDSHA